LLWESPPLSDPASGQTVALDFVFNHDTEPEYDFLRVEYETAQGWIQTLAVDGTNADASGVFPSPGALYASI
jgi:hypothetical protein